MRRGGQRPVRLAIAAACSALLALASPAPASASGSPLPVGADCSTAVECASTFCVDGVCCDSACDGPFDTCDAPPEPGLCVQVAPAPPVSRRGLLTGLALLTLIGAAALWHQRRDLRGSNA